MAESSPSLREVDLRAAVRRSVAAAHRDESTLLLDEFSVCRARARVDIAVVNGSLTGYELKSDVDKLDRLRSQVPQYSRVFDQMTLVTGQRHVSKAATAIPQWWGIWLATGADDGETVVREIRPAGTNPSLCARSVAGLLWREEMQDVLALHQVQLRTRNRTRKELIDAITETMSLETVRGAVRDALQLRRARVATIGTPLAE